MRTEFTSFASNDLMRPTQALESGIVDPPAESAGPAFVTSERLMLGIGELRVLCDADVGREVILPPAVTPLPHTPAWLQGVASVRGALVPVVDLAMAFGLEHVAQQSPYLMISGSGDSAIGLLVEGLPVLKGIDFKRKLDGIPPHPEMLDGLVRCAVEHAGSIWLDVKLADLFRKLGERIAVNG